MEKKNQDLEGQLADQEQATIKAAKEAAHVAEEQRNKIAEKEAARFNL